MATRDDANVAVLSQRVINGFNEVQNYVMAKGIIEQNISDMSQTFHQMSQEIVSTYQDHIYYRLNEYENSSSTYQYLLVKDNSTASGYEACMQYIHYFSQPKYIYIEWKHPEYPTCAALAKIIGVRFPVGETTKINLKGNNVEY